MEKAVEHPHDRSKPVSVARVGPNLPRATATDVVFGGFTFAGGEPGPVPGLFALTRGIQDFLYPVLFGEADNMAAALAKLRADDLALTKGLADGVCFMARDNSRMRKHILRDLVGNYNPPLNAEFRKGRAASQIAALIPDRAEMDFPLAAEESALVEVSEQELRALVREFYGKARQDPLIGPVFNRHITDWEHHFDLVQSFWSRFMLGTTRYTGTPFAPHVGINLKPEFFDRWLSLFRETAKGVLQPAAARAAIDKVEHMSVAFQAGLFPPKLTRDGQ